MLTLASAPIVIPDAAQIRLLCARLDVLDSTAPLELAAEPSPALAGAALPAPRPVAPVRVNTLRWPSGAGRWAEGYFLLDPAGVATVRNAVAAADDGTVPLVASFPDLNTGEDLTTNVLVLRYVPIAAVVVEAGAGGDAEPGAAGATGPTLGTLYLVHVVDDRWRWQQVACPDFGIGPGSGTGGSPVQWADCFGQCFDALGLPPTKVAVPAVYLVPDSSLNLAGAPVGPVLDALAANIGCVVVRRWDGTVLVMSLADSLRARATDLAANPDRPVLGGGGDPIALGPDATDS